MSTPFLEIVIIASRWRACDDADNVASGALTPAEFDGVAGAVGHN